MHITYHFGVLTCQVRSKLWIHFKTSLGSPDIFLPLTWFPRQRKHPCFVKRTRCRFSKLCSQSELLVWLLWPKHFRLYDRLIPVVVYIDLSPQNALILCRWIFCKFSLVFFVNRKSKRLNEGISSCLYLINLLNCVHVWVTTMDVVTVSYVQ